MGKIEKLMKVDFESKPVYGDDNEHIKTKISIIKGGIITNFHNKNMPQEKVPCKCLSIVMLDSVIKANKKHYLQALLEEYKYVQEKIKTENYIDEDLRKKGNQIVTLMIGQNMIIAIANITNNLLKSILIVKEPNSLC